MPRTPRAGADILYAYGNAGEEGDYIPGADETTLNERVLQLTVAVGSTENVTAQIGGSGIFVTYEEMDTALNDLGLVVLNHSKSGVGSPVHRAGREDRAAAGQIPGKRQLLLWQYRDGGRGGLPDADDRRQSAGGWDVHQRCGRRNGH